LRESSYLVLGLAFLLVTAGLRMMGGQILSVALGMGLVVASYLLFYRVFNSLMHAR